MVLGSIGFTVLYMVVLYAGVDYLIKWDEKESKEDRELWLLARFPRPVVIVMAMLINSTIDNASNLIILTWLAAIFLLFIFFGLTGAVVFVVMTLGTVFVLLAYEKISEHYKKIDEALPKREKKQEDE